MSEMKAKDRMKIPRQNMPERDAQDRASNFEEVNLGYTLQMAKEEAERCLRCKKPVCMDGCPVSVQIPDFIKMVAEGKYKEAAEILKTDNSLPAVCGRVCPQEEQCEKHCILAKKGHSVAIGNLERFVADWEMSNISDRIIETPKKSGKKSGGCRRRSFRIKLCR